MDRRAEFAIDRKYPRCFPVQAKLTLAYPGFALAVSPQIQCGRPKILIEGFAQAIPLAAGRAGAVKQQRRIAAAHPRLVDLGEGHFVRADPDRGPIRAAA